MNKHWLIKFPPHPLAYGFPPVLEIVYIPSSCMYLKLPRSVQSEMKQATAPQNIKLPYINGSVGVWRVVHKCNLDFLATDHIICWEFRPAKFTCQKLEHEVPIFLRNLAVVVKHKKVKQHTNWTFFNFDIIKGIQRKPQMQ